jgi:hypothetical protein
MHPLSYLLDILHEEFIKECTATPTDWLKPIHSESYSVVTCDSVAPGVGAHT